MKKPSNEKYSSLHVVLFPVFKISVSSKLPELLPIKKMGLFGWQNTHQGGYFVKQLKKIFCHFFNLNTDIN